jgi:hypothetical protein
MKFLMSILLLFSVAQAQTVGVNINDVNAEEGTTIEIKKRSGGYGAIVKPNEPLFEITQGEEDLVGDGAPLLKDARNNWKKSCNDWKKEFKDMNKLNQIITMNCGKQICATEAMETTCSSKATYKLKVRLN